MTKEERTTRMLNAFVFCMLLGMAAINALWDFPQQTSAVVSIYRSLADQERQHLSRFLFGLGKLVAILGFGIAWAGKFGKTSPKQAS